MDYDDETAAIAAVETLKEFPGVLRAQLIEINLRIDWKAENASGGKAVDMHDHCIKENKQ